VSVLYQALQAAETHEQHIWDAELAGDQKLARFLRQVQEEGLQQRRPTFAYVAAALLHAWNNAACHAETR
jgi:hypothetical protein